MTINGAIGKAAVSGDTIKVAAGTYTGIGTEVVLINKDITLSGGWNAGFTTQSGTSIINGQAARRGIKIGSVTVTIEKFTIQNGFQNAYNSGGGGIFNDQGNATFNNIIVIGNISNGDFTGGGGISNNGTMILNNSTITGNSADGYSSGGAGIYNLGTITLNNSSVSGNHSSGGYPGGGIYNYAYSGSVTLNNSTVSNNIAGGGAGIYNQGTLNVNSSTIARNTAISGGGVNGSSGSITIKNSILAGNTGGSWPDCVFPPTSAGYNIIGTSCNFTPTTGDLVNVDPKLGQLIGNPGYIPLLSNSPAVNAGNPAGCMGSTGLLTTDQRGIARIGTCDIGAYEYTVPGVASSLSVVGGSGQKTAPLFTFSKPLQVAALDSQGSPVSSVNVTFIAPASGASGTFANTGTNTTSAVTDGYGIATTSIFTANNQFGSYTVSAAVSGAGSVNFGLSNAVWYVATTGNDLNSCTTTGSPCATINGVIGKATDGDTVFVASGTFIGSGSEVVLINKSINLYGGWNAGFTSQTGTSIIDGQSTRIGVNVNFFTTAMLERFVIQNGSSGGVGNYGNLTINYSTIKENIDAGIVSSGNLTINKSLVTNNTGRGISVGGAGVMAIVNNSTISNNDSGIENGGSSLSLNNVTVYGNTSLISFRGGIRNTGGLVTIQNSIVAGNISGNEVVDCMGVITSAGYNLIGNNTISYCTFNAATGDLVGTGANPIKPRLTPLQDNGGSTLTHALMTGSVAINAGNPAAPGSGGNTCLSTDQRGVARPVGGRCDIGAYEGSVPFVPVPLINTYTAGGTSSLPGSFLCSQTQPNCTNGVNPHADAAQKYALGTFNLYATKHVRDSIDNNGMVITSTVHYCNPSFTCPYANAFWSGTQMVYGDAYGFPLADDVVAHELTHGVTDYESNLFYFYQSGAINESLSDVWGEYYDQTNGLGTDTPAAKWLMGEDVSGAGAVRNMSNPPAFGDPDKMTSANYDKTDLDNGGVHTNSGVNNKAVFLMVDGGIFNSKTVSAIGWDKTEALYYEAQTNLLSSGADYSDLYYVLQQACVNLTGQLGITASDCLQVKNALDAVEMNLQPVANFNPDAPLCAPGMYSGLPLFLDKMESGTGKWTMTGAWSLQSGYASSPTHMLYGDDFYSSSDSAAAMTTGVALPVSSNMFLHFKHAFAFEYDAGGNYDGGVLEYSNNNGASWVDASPKFIDGQNYKGTILNYPGSTNVLKGRSAFVGDSHGYVSSRYNLTSLGGQTVKFRWRFATDDSFYYLGWMVDDVQIYICGLTPPPAPAVISSVRANADPTGATNVNFTVTFSQPVTGVDAGDFSLTTSGVLGAAVSGVSGSESVYTVTVSTGSGSGTIHLNVTDNDSIVNALSMPLGGSGASNGNFTSGETYTITKTWIFGDVPNTYWANTSIERLYNAGITGGCSAVPLNYCPTTPVTRAQMAIFLLRGMHGSAYAPPPATGTRFGDVTLGTFGAAWIEQLATEGITSGCGSGNYCPTTSVTRAQMAIFLVRAKHGIAFTPPTATGIFADVPIGSFGANHIEQLSVDGITSGCGGGYYCPNTTVKRDSMAVFLVKTFNLP